MDDERVEELSSITAIFPEIVFDPSDPFTIFLDLPVEPSTPLTVRFPAVADALPPPQPSTTAPKVALDTHRLVHLPPLRLKASLPQSYPADAPPLVELHTTPPWLPASVLERLVDEGTKLWEEYGRGQVVFAYIDFLQQEAERAFDLVDAGTGFLEMPPELKVELLDFDLATKRKKFDLDKFTCGVCFELKRGAVCHPMSRCGHVFCKACLQDFYNNCIQEGDVASVKCIDPECRARNNPRLNGAKRRKKSATLSPNELLQIPLEKDVVMRYVDIKRKKKLESDKSTIYCPRQWCQGPARSKKHPKKDPFAAGDDESDSEDEDGPRAEESEEKETERLAICEDCNFAFCRVCLAGWHGDFFRCGPRTKEELSAEEKASYDFIRTHTTPCPTCSVPAQKTHGCNHMNCFQCETHYCYLCSSWLHPANPYEHYNSPGTPCFQRLWDLEEGDEGDGHVQFLGARGAEVQALAAERAEAEAAVAQVAEVEAATGNGDHGLVEAMQQANEGLQQANEGLQQWLDAIQQAMRNLDVVMGEPPGAARRPLRNNERAQAAQAANRLQQPAAAQGARPRDDMLGRRLRRFLQMVRNDEEDEWDSDELDDDENDEGWQIPHA